MRRRGLHAVALVLLVAATALAGCFGGDDEEPDPDPIISGALYVQLEGDPIDATILLPTPYEDGELARLARQMLSNDRITLATGHGERSYLQVSLLGPTVSQPVVLGENWTNVTWYDPADGSAHEGSTEGGDSPHVVRVGQSTGPRVLLVLRIGGTLESDPHCGAAAALEGVLPAENASAALPIQYDDFCE